MGARLRWFQGSARRQERVAGDQGRSHRQEEKGRELAEERAPEKDSGRGRPLRGPRPRGPSQAPQEGEGEGGRAKIGRDEASVREDIGLEGVEKEGGESSRVSRDCAG